MLAFIAGIFFCENIVGIVIITILFILYEICLFLYKNVRINNIAGIVLFISFLVGVLFCSYFNGVRREEIKQFDDGKFEVIGTVCTEGEKKGSYWQYILRDNAINNKKIRSKVLIKSKYNLEYGDRIKVIANFELPSGARNKNTFSYSKYLETLDIFITAKTQDTSVSYGKKILLAEKISYVIRKKVREFTDFTLGKEEMGILNALIIGDDTLINGNVKSDYKNAGMVHLLVVSGGHTAFLILLLKYIFSFFNPSRNLAKILYIISIILYIFITGASPSVLRAGIGIIIIMIAEIIGRQTDGLTTISLVALVIIIANPNILYSLSFLLSFGGVLGIMICYSKLSSKLEKIPQKIREPFALTVSAQLFVTPITLYSFNVIYLGGFISNLFALNFAGIIMMSGIILFIVYLFIPPLVVFPMKAVGFLIFLMNKIAEFFGSLDFFTYYEVTPSCFSIFIYYVLLIYLFRDRRKNNKEKGLTVTNKSSIKAFAMRNIKLIILICGVLSIFISNINFINTDKALKIAVIDVGHGDCIFITTPENKHILIDTGDKHYQGENVIDTGEQTVVPYLLKQGIKKIDLVILTHMDSDHIGGYESITKAIKIETLGLSINSAKKEEYPKIRDISVKKDIKIKSLKSGDTFAFGGIELCVLMPEKVETVDEENNDSIVILMKYGDKKALFMGDLEVEGEEKLLSSGVQLKADILKLGHHGSITSTSENFVKAVNPEIALISVGNRFKSIPGKDVLNRLNSIYAKVYRTDKNGEINVIVKDNEIRVKTTY